MQEKAKRAASTLIEKTGLLDEPLFELVVEGQQIAVRTRLFGTCPRNEQSQDLVISRIRPVFSERVAQTHSLKRASKVVLLERKVDELVSPIAVRIQQASALDQVAKPLSFGRTLDSSCLFEAAGHVGARNPEFPAQADPSRDRT